jgi:hypothetical protein
MEFLKVTLRQNGFADPQIRMALNPPVKVAPPSYKPGSVAYLPHIRSIFNSITRVLFWHNVKSVGENLWLLSTG